MATQGDDLVTQGGKVCAICSRIASRVSYSTSCIVSCCSKKKLVHKACAKKVFLVTNPGAVFNLNTWITDDNSKVLCSECAVACFFCNDTTHHLKNRGVKFGRCNTTNCTKWCYYISGCLNKGNFTSEDYMCSECSNKRANDLELQISTPIIMTKRDTSSENNPKFISKISEQKYEKIQESLYSVINAMSNNNDLVPNKCNSLEECSEYLEKHFSHLDEQSGNIFDPNNTQNDISPFSLTIDSLRRLIMTKDDGWLNDVLINQVVHLLNFHAEYEPKNKIAGAKVRLVCFGDTSTDHHKLNPRNVMCYNYIRGDVPKVCQMKCNEARYSTFFKQEVNTWYSKLGNTMLDKILAYYDANQQIIQEFCAPVNLKQNHWILMHVLMPCTRYSNGKVFLTNHDANDNVPFHEQYSYSSVILSQMWWAKWFGIYHKESTTTGIIEAHLDYNDMRIDRFSLKESTDILNTDLVSSLDHDTNSCHGIGVQTDGYNCGIWVILEMFNRMEGFTSAVGDKTTADLNEYRVTLFNLIIRIYDLLSQEAFVHDGLNANPVVPISPLSAKK